MSIAAKIRVLKKKTPRVDWPDYLKQDRFVLAKRQFLDMAKDFVDTFKPYKSKWYLLRDLKQPRSGFWHLLLSLIFMARFLANLIFIMLPKLLASIFTTPSKDSESLGAFLYRTAATLVFSLTLAIRGLTQVVTAPLTWLRIIARGIHAAVKGWQRFTENAGVKRLLKAAEASLSQDNDKVEMESICNELHKKLRKQGIDRDQPIDLGSDTGGGEYEIYSLTQPPGGIYDAHKAGILYVQIAADFNSFVYSNASNAFSGSKTDKARTITCQQLGVEGSLTLALIQAKAARVFEILKERKHTKVGYFLAKDLLDAALQGGSSDLTDLTRRRATNYLRLFGACQREDETAQPRQAYRFGLNSCKPY